MIIVKRIVSNGIFTSNNKGVISVFTERETETTKKGRKVKAQWLKQIKHGRNF